MLPHDCLKQLYNLMYLINDNMGFSCTLCVNGNVNVNVRKLCLVSIREVTIVHLRYVTYVH